MHSIKGSADALQPPRGLLTEQLPSCSDRPQSENSRICAHSIQARDGDNRSEAIQDVILFLDREAMLPGHVTRHLREVRDMSLQEDNILVGNESGSVCGLRAGAPKEDEE